MELLRTPRLALRSWEPADVDVFFDIYSRWSVMRWLGPHPRRPHASVDQSRRAIETWRRRESPPFGLWAIVPHGRTPVGTALLLPLDGGDEVEVGWHLHPDHEGHGWATESARALLGLHPGRVLALTDPGNERSQAVCRRLGLTDEGTTDRWFGTTMRRFSRAGAGSAPDRPPG